METKCSLPIKALAHLAFQQREQRFLIFNKFCAAKCIQAWSLCPISRHFIKKGPNYSKKAFFIKRINQMAKILTFKSCEKLIKSCEKSIPHRPKKGAVGNTIARIIIYSFAIHNRLNAILSCFKQQLRRRINFIQGSLVFILR